MDGLVVPSAEARACPPPPPAPPAQRPPPHHSTPPPAQVAMAQEKAGIICKQGCDKHRDYSYNNRVM